MRPLELWGGLECTVNRVRGRVHDQIERSGHAQRLDDIERFASLGLTSIRYPVLWERVAPDHPDTHDWRWTDGRLARLRDHGLKPIVGLLHHGSGPTYTSLDAAEFPEMFARFARAAAERYPWVTDWTPVNEPLTTARFSGLYGHWYPHGRDDRTFLRILINELRATALAMGEIRTIIPGARLVQTEDLGRTSGTPRLKRQIRHESHRRWLTWDLLCGRVNERHPMYRWLRRGGITAEELAFFTQSPCPPDVMGINYYLTSDRWLDEQTELYPEWSRGGNGQLAYADVEAVRARPKGIVGHETHLLSAWRRYGRPVALTEVHLGGTRDDQMRWLVEAWRAAERARAQGADICAVTLWSLLGSYDWDSLVTLVRDHYEPGPFDVRGPEPRRTALAKVATELVEARPPEHPVLHTEGWWRRPSRLAWGPAASPVPERPLTGPPILVVGSRGTLGRAFARICAERGLRARVASRQELDLCDPGSVDAALRTLRPWAVINAAGFVRVDDAESDHDGCWRDNVTAPVNLAAACRRRRVPLVTFSSDLVFDGTAARPYVESDAPTPLNVYGRSKAEAEARVLELLPNALVVRTSAFFGPWDAYNFATVARRALREGRIFPAAADAVVSPTYVPDLVHAVLDLLIDEERGLWHLSNTGAVSWWEFGRMVAQAGGFDEALIVPGSWRDIWQPATRPAYSALDSNRGRLLRPLDAAVQGYIADLTLAESQDEVRRVSS